MLVLWEVLEVDRLVEVDWLVLDVENDVLVLVELVETEVLVDCDVELVLRLVEVL